jgi:hypothetical protein
MLPALEQELEMYHNLATAALTANPNPTVDELWQFWQANILTLPEWSNCAMEIGLVMTSSGCVERIFSLYTSMFDVEQESALEDLREASIMLRFNEGQRRSNPL